MLFMDMIAEIQCRRLVNKESISSRFPPLHTAKKTDETGLTHWKLSGAFDWKTFNAD
jgi:hypothetical protein